MFVVDTEKLEAGRPLRVDLVTLDGRLLAKANTRISAELKSGWIERGISKVCSYQQSDFTEFPALLRPYNPLMMQRLEANLERASQSVVSQSERIKRNELADLQELNRFTDELLSDVKLDIASVLAMTFGVQLAAASDNDQEIAHRSSRLSVLGMAIGTQMGWGEGDVRAVGIAGLLHDISLMSITSEAVNFVAGRLPTRDRYLDHPLASAYLLESILGLDKRICMVVGQVHELLNGEGFPQGVSAHRMTPLARVLCVADAYLTLTSRSQPKPLPRGCNLLPCDAVGYLMHHAAQGRFCADSVKSLVYASSLYPIGSRVVLSDQSVAVVLRSTSKEPAKPVVRMDDSSFSIIDLCNSPLSISGPADSVAGGLQQMRISKSNLNKILFR